MRSLLFVSACLGLGLSLGACATPKVPARSPESPAAQSSETAKAPEQAPTETPTTQDNAAPSPGTIAVTLLNAGEEPRSELRIKPTLNQTFTVTQNTHTNVATLINGQPVAQSTLPIVVQTITYKTIDVQPDRVTFSWTASMNAQSGPGVDPKALEKMKAQLAGAKDIKGQSIFDLRGVLLENKVEHDNPELLNALSHLWSPFPAEPVGKGASWKTEHTRVINGFAATESTVYAIEKLQDGMVVTSADANTTGQPGPFHHPDLPPGASIDLKSMEGSSSKETSIRNHSFFQDTSTQNAQLTTVLNMKNDGKDQEIVTETTLKVTSQTKVH